MYTLVLKSINDTLGKKPTPQIPAGCMSLVTYVKRAAVTNIKRELEQIGKMLH
jgi:hypothetical protein